VLHQSARSLYKCSPHIQERAERGAASALHVIVLDELDAFARSRGTLGGDTSGIRDSIVNQLLAKIDGVDALDNVLIVGLTNRPELIDAALLRPGRLEVHVAIGMPDVRGRQQIIDIHAQRLMERGSLAPRAAAAVSSGALAAATERFSGADLGAVLRSAASFALERYLSALFPPATEDAASEGAARAEASTAERRLQVTFGDLERALREVRPSAHRRLLFGRLVPGGLVARCDGFRRVRRLKQLTRRVLLNDNE